MSIARFCACTKDLIMRKQHGDVSRRDTMSKGASCLHETRLAKNHMETTVDMIKMYGGTTVILYPCLYPHSIKIIRFFEMIYDDT